ncbi:helix-turn-helix domain-containing protein [Paraburkholderia tropica]|uniref:hypothetical protein n=1 Tax=Paraburkholderia tropica TaxID=92647 RepID=UPI002AB0F9BE|nr:hypothetical protein [Paraburkholderia tropica]
MQGMSQQAVRTDFVADPCVGTQAAKAKRIGFVLFKGFALPDVAAIIEIYDAANALAQLQSDDDAAAFEMVSLSAAGGPVESASSVVILTEGVEQARDAGAFHTLFVAGGAGTPDAVRDARLVQWLAREGRRSEAVVALAEGRLLLAAAGLPLLDVRGGMDGGLSGLNAIGGALAS